MSELTPITRIETYLDAIVNSGTPPLEDITRIETFLEAIYDNQVCQLTPITRIEMFLGKISGQDIVLPEPITRIELYLAAIAGEDVELPEMPITRLEMYLADWADSGDWTTIRGAIVEFVTTRAHELKSCVVTLEPKQDLSHGDPSPTNICPISGWTGCEVYRTGKNLLDTSGILPVSLRQTSFASIPLDSKVLQRATEESITIKLLGSLGTGKTQFALYIYDTVNNNAFYVGNSQMLTLANNFTLTGLFQAGGSGVDYTKPLTLRIYAQPYDGDASSEITGLMIAFGSDTEYEEYCGDTISVSWEDEDETVYSGTLDITAGTLTATWAKVILNGSENWHSADGSGFPYLDFNSLKKLGDYTSAIKSDKLIAVAHSYTLTSKNFSITGYSDPHGSYPNQNWLYINADGRNTATAIKEWLSVNPTEVCYELATPITIQLTPQQITALKGYNAMWSNAGNVTVTFRGTPIEEPDAEPLQALNLLLGGAYHNNQTQDDVSDEEALDILLGGADR